MRNRNSGALNVLLRILNERKFGEEPIPLISAIATSNPMREEYYNEPLDPANLDRFAIQLCVTGLLQGGDAARARTLVDRFVEGQVVEQPEAEAVLDRETFDRAFAALGRIAVPDAVKDALLQVYRVLVFDYDCDDTNSLLTDRSFLVKALKLLRGRALLRGSDRVGLEDLDVLRWMTTFRVPEGVHEKVPEIVAQVRAKLGESAGDG